MSVIFKPDGTGDQNLFQTIAVSGQNNVVADSTTDTLTLVAGSNITITTDASTDSITIASAGGGVANLAYTASSTQGTVTSDTGTDATIPAADGTNAGLFLPAEKTKLAGIAEGAEVNVNADWNASSGDAQILNKPTLGTAAATNSTDYATAAQGAKADTAVQPAAIGSTVLAFDSNLQSFVNAFTLPTTDGTAGQSLVTNGAGVLSFSSINSLPDGATIGGVAYFNRPTKPTERSTGVPLVTGDRWYKPNDGAEWFWNGTYWLSPPFVRGSVISVTDLSTPVGFDNLGLFVHNIRAKGRVASGPPNWNASNYWYANLFYAGYNLNNLALLNNATHYVGGTDFHYDRTFPLNQVLAPQPLAEAGSLSFFVQIRSAGNPTPAGPGGSSLSYFFKLSHIYP